MAGVLDALASYVTNMLTEMAKEEVAMLIGVSGEIDKLAIKLRDLKNFLADADRRNITDTSVQAWVEELKRAMYDATDILDLCQLKVMEEGPSKDMGCLNPLLRCMRNPLHAHNIGSRIKELNEKLDGICTRGRSFDFIKLEAFQDHKLTRPRVVDRKTNPLLERSGVVGEKIKEDTIALVELLTKEVPDENDSIMVAAIVGVGGIGKTTLSKKVFNDQVIQDKFTKKIWLSITHQFNKVELLRTAITSVDGILPGPSAGSEDEALLVPALANAIRDKKLFLVLDDMWGTDEWTSLLKAPISHSAPGSRVLITTRHETVARGMRALHPYHHINKLGPEDGWSLLTKQVLEAEKSEPVIEVLKDIGLKIVEKCDGLPLAIKVMGGLLCQKEKVRRDWENILNNDIWSVSQMPKELNHAFYLSYDDLDPCLKQCFLHFSLMPKKTEIWNSEFVGMWIGEGFVHGNSDKLEDLGFEYHRELVLRNLIEPDPGCLYPNSFHMHDVVRSFAHFVARHEALATHNVDIKSQLSLQTFIRLSVETKGMESDGFEWRNIQEQKSLRSIILIGSFKIQYGDSLNTFSSLRTIHIEHANVSALVECLHQLKHLRYLSLKKCNDIHSLPENIQKIKFLQHICLCGCENLVKLPDSTGMLGELRFLCIEGTSVDSMPRGFSALTNLRTLHGFRAHMDSDWCSLEELGPLLNLREIELEGLGDVSAASFATKARLGEKMHLTKMELTCRSRLGDDGLVKEAVCEKDQSINKEVFDELYPPPCIEHIFIEGYFACQLPRWMLLTATRPLQSLKSLNLADLACCAQLPDGLCKLPCLEYLQVSRAPAITRVGPEFLQPHSRCHRPSSQMMAGFLTLRTLSLVGMLEWEEWVWEEEVQAMPVLEKFFLMDCKLRYIPPGLASHARSLQKLTIGSVQQLKYLCNFASIVELMVYDNPDLTWISNFPKLQKLQIDRCPKLESLQDMDALRRLVLTIDHSEKQLPLYLQNVKPNHLLLDCSPKVLALVAAGKSGCEWEKFSHVQQVEAYSDDYDQDIEKRWHLFYTSQPYNIETNIEPSLQDPSEDEYEEDEDKEE